MLFSKSEETSVTKISSLALFNIKGGSLMRCGSLCLEDHCCKEFKYSQLDSRRCVGIQFKDFKSTINTHSVITGCETGWFEFKGHCYYKGQTKVTWSDAKECGKMCSYLIEIESKEEADWISATFLDSVNCRPDIFFDCTAWTGLNDLDIEGTYVWDHSNGPLIFSNWHHQEPSLLSKSEALTKDCIDILRGGVWNDRPCSYLNWVICEKTF
ncbi:low affinity immunoglobulin epsilon Fc receptor-like [Crassostrea virginica]